MRRGWRPIATGIVVVGAVFLLLRWYSDRGGDATGEPGVTGTSTPRAVPEIRAADANSPGAIGDVVPATTAADTEFIQRLRRVAAHRMLADTPYPAEVVDLIASSRIPEAAALLETKAAQGDRDANVVLAYLNWQCEGNEPSLQPQPQIDALRASLQGLPVRLRERIELSRAVEERLRGDLSRACGAARFDPVAIDRRLADAAAEGHEASLWEVGRRSIDPDLRHKNWLSAAMLGYVPAQLGLAEILMAESLQGDRRNRGRMNFWLEAAAKHSPRALALLGECRLNGCNAQPPDAESALPLLRDAAVQGESTALSALTSISRGDPAAPADAELFALHSFHLELNELGCFGAGAYGSLAIEMKRAVEEIGSRMSPSGVDEARLLADSLWREHAVRARQLRGCD